MRENNQIKEQKIETNEEDFSRRFNRQENIKGCIEEALKRLLIWAAAMVILGIIFRSKL